MVLVVVTLTEEETLETSEVEAEVDSMEEEVVD